MRRFRRKLHLWLIAHGLEFEGGQVECHIPHDPRSGSISRNFCIIINHRYYGVGLAFEVYRGALEDDLNKTHKEVAAECARLDEKYGR